MILEITLSILLIMTVLFLLPLLRKARNSVNNLGTSAELETTALVFSSAKRATDNLKDGGTSVTDIKALLASCQTLQDL